MTGLQSVPTSCSANGAPWTPISSTRWRPICGATRACAPWRQRRPPWRGSRLSRTRAPARGRRTAYGRALSPMENFSWTSSVTINWLRWPSRGGGGRCRASRAPARSRTGWKRNSSGASARRPPWRPGWTPPRVAGATLVAALVARGTAGAGRYISDMCSHYQAEKRRKQIEKHFGIRLPPELGAAARRPAHLPDADGAVHPPAARARIGRRGGAGLRARRGPFRPAAGLRQGRRGTASTRTTRAPRPSASSRASRTPGPSRGIASCPCEAIYEPDWRSGQFVPTRFTAANDETLGVAGLWSPWKNPETAKWELSFTMLTINADTHPLSSSCTGPIRSARRTCRTSAWS